MQKQRRQSHVLQYRRQNDLQVPRCRHVYRAPHITLSTSSSLPQSVPLCSFAPSLTHRLSFDSLPRSLLSSPILNLPLSQVRAGRRAACVRPTPTATIRRESPPSAESPRCARTRAHTRGGTMVSEDAQPCACVRVRALERACLPHSSAPEPAEAPVESPRESGMRHHSNQSGDSLRALLAHCGTGSDSKGDDAGRGGGRSRPAAVGYDSGRSAVRLEEECVWGCDVISPSLSVPLSPCPCPSLSLSRPVPPL